MNNFIYFFILVYFFLTSCNQKENPLEIDIETTGYSDSTLMYLTDVKTDATIDSGFIFHNKLKFLLKLDEPTQLILLTDYKKREDFEFKFFWKENHRIEIKAKKGDLKNALIIGSEIQRQVDILNSRKTHLQEKLDSLQNKIYSLKDSTERIEIVKIAQKEILKRMTILDIEYIKQYPDYLNSAIVLINLSKNIPKNQSVELFENLAPNIQTSKYGEEIKKYLELRKDIKIGDRAIDFKIPDLGGKIIELSQFKNKYIILDFWASWCGPCRKENPNLLKNYNKYKNKGFEIIGINLDKKFEDWEIAVKKDGITWITASGNENEVTSVYNIQALPKSYLINPDGIIIAEDLKGESLDEKLNEIFAK